MFSLFSVCFEEEEVPGDNGDANLSALQRLSLQRKSNSSSRLDENPNVAQGIRGLHFRGRAGLAKKNLASLAPDFLPGAEARDARTGFEGLDLENLHLSKKRNKRPAEVQREEVEVAEAEAESVGSTSRPSKLAALAAARTSSAKAISRNLPDAGSKEVHVEAKPPLSKLQQKMQANLLARQQRKQSTLSKEDSALQIRQQEEEERNKALLLPTGQPITSLFPVTSLGNIESRLDSDCVSPFGAVLKSQGSNDLGIPGGPSFLSTSLSKAFSDPSPDDIVLRAREGTNLGKS